MHRKRARAWWTVRRPSRPPHFLDAALGVQTYLAWRAAISQDKSGDHPADRRSISLVKPEEPLLLGPPTSISPGSLGSDIGREGERGGGDGAAGAAVGALLSPEDLVEIAQLAEWICNQVAQHLASLVQAVPVLGRGLPDPGRKAKQLAKKRGLPVGKRGRAGDTHDRLILGAFTVAAPHRSQAVGADTLRQQ